MLGGTLAACGLTNAPPPTESEARAFLGRVADLASAGQLDEMCELGASNCARILERSGEPPATPPTIVGFRAIEAVATGEGRSPGGLVLELCGENRGETYYSEMLVFREDEELLAIEPVYWSGFVIEEDGAVGGQSPDPAARCAQTESE